MSKIPYSYETSLGNLTNKASKALGKRLVANFKSIGFDITTDQWVILMGLWIKDGQNQQELAEFSEKDKTSITRIIDSLEKKGFVTRKVNKQDRRVNFIYLTQMANDSKAILYAQAEKTLEVACQNISDEDIEKFSGFLNTICLNLTSV